MPNQPIIKTRFLCSAMSLMLTTTSADSVVPIGASDGDLVLTSDHQQHHVMLTTNGGHLMDGEHHLVMTTANGQEYIVVVANGIGHDDDELQHVQFVEQEEFQVIDQV